MKLLTAAATHIRKRQWRSPRQRGEFYDFSVTVVAALKAILGKELSQHIKR